MGFNLFFRRTLENEPVAIFGDGKQTRDFTFVADVISAMVASAARDGVVGEVINVGGGHRISLLEVLDVIDEVVGHAVERRFVAPMKGDARHTAADISKAGTLLDYSPRFTLTDGLRAEWEWLRSTTAEKPVLGAVG